MNNALCFEASQVVSCRRRQAGDGSQSGKTLLEISGNMTAICSRKGRKQMEK
jgi:hypothetical protein